MPIRTNVAGSHAGESQASAQTVLLLACGTGSRLAFEALYRDTSAKLFGICLYYLNNRAEAEEVLQETYTSVWLKASSFDPGLSSACTWLAAMARHKAIDRRRARLRHEPLDAVDQWPTQDTVLDTVERDCQGAAIERCLGTLEADLQRYIRVAFFEGYSYAELAERHSIPLGTMKSWIRRGLLRLRVCLGL
ncbi:sigma-70 family RNA polymerase sigma factor [Pseudomonas sp. RIT-PI-S]|uniref:sigma-70 family RNA polymerase sigma factor n=1 Tax=Pseudomonas sp. RIT-PI-S TaxID=3035295 RepID=UPI0021D8A532|nr:sigma-70 family RNA polymerase sigma factor [Pseudomonas sp. RIT-PI-S]